MRDVVWLHGEAGPSWNGFHDALARRWHVLAPSHPGLWRIEPAATSSTTSTTRSTSTSTCSTRSTCATWRWWAMVWVGCLPLSLPPSSRTRFSHLVLIDPFGLWLPDVPTLDYFVLPPAELAEALYHDPGSPAAQATARAPEGQEALIAYMLERAQSMAAAARYLWPIPDRGLSKRLHRVTAPNAHRLGPERPRRARGLWHRMAAADSGFSARRLSGRWSSPPCRRALGRGRID